jgi:hypothetical protein
MGSAAAITLPSYQGMPYLDMYDSGSFLKGSTEAALDA